MKTGIQIKEKIGDFFIDIAKLIFAGVVLSTILNVTENKIITLFFAIWSTIFFAATGFFIYKPVKKGGEK